VAAAQRLGRRGSGRRATRAGATAPRLGACPSVFGTDLNRPALPASKGLVGDNQFVEGVVSGFLLIFFSEIGDK
jgi:hypothetical protein